MSEPPWRWLCDVVPCFSLIRGGVVMVDREGGRRGYSEMVD